MVGSLLFTVLKRSHIGSGEGGGGASWLSGARRSHPQREGGWEAPSLPEGGGDLC